MRKFRLVVPTFIFTIGCSLAIPTPGHAQVATVSSIFTTFVRDLKQLPSTSTAITLGAGGALALAAHPNDRTITDRAQASVRLDRTLEIGEHLGSGWIQVGGAFGTLLAGRVSGNTRIALLGRDLVRAQAVNAALTQGLKLTVGRSRPDGGRYSFPSGHASSSFATATVLQRHYGWKAGVPAYALAGYVAASRLQENKHFASDVIVGAALGIAVGRTVTIGRGAHRFALSPVAVPGGVGMTLVRTSTR